MPYNSETETFYQAPATVVDSTPDGDTVQEGFDDRLTPALTALYDDLNLLKADGMISVGIPATTTARGIGRVATSADLVDGATINNGPAFLAAGVHTSVAAAAGKVPMADADGSLNDGWLLRAAPTGFSGFYAGDTPPDGWFEENGAPVSRTTYARLFAVIGTRYGVGNGSTTFNLPDSRGLVKRAWDNGKGIDSGRTLGSTQQPLAGTLNMQGIGDDGDDSTGDFISLRGIRFFTSGGNIDLVPSGYANVPVTPGDVRMANLALMGIIKY